MIITVLTIKQGIHGMSLLRSISKPIKTLVLLCSISLLNGCFATKVITVPMRVGGAVISVIPVVGDVADDAIDAAADGVDLIPI